MLLELLGKKEKLNPELVPYLQGDLLRHPLVYSVPHHPDLNALVNHQFIEKDREVNKAFREKEWNRYIWLHEKPYRINAFINIKKHLSDEEYWKTLCSIWVESENIWQNFTVWKKLLKSKRNEKNAFMRTNDRFMLATMPETLEIFRGCTHNKNERGLSYTLNWAKADWFAKRFENRKGIVIRCDILKKDIFAYVSQRNESEIVILNPRKRMNVKKMWAK